MISPYSVNKRYALNNRGLTVMNGRLQNPENTVSLLCSYIVHANVLIRQL